MKFARHARPAPGPARRPGAALAATALLWTLSSCSDVEVVRRPAAVTTAATVPLTATGVSPRPIVVPLGGSITFANDDTRRHKIASDPHPDHSGCVELNLPVLEPGQRITVKIDDDHERCGFHDDLNPQQAAFNGTVLVETEPE